MSEARTAAPQPTEARTAPPDGGQSRVVELKVSGNLMTLEAGLFCVFQMPVSTPPDARSGLPGVRISLPPGPGSRPEAVTISTFRDDGWLDGRDGAALIRVTGGPAQVLVTVYQAPSATPDTAPRLQVMRLGPDAGDQSRAPAVPARASSLEDADVVAHIQRTGDVGTKLGQWIGTRGSGLWIEGFGLTPHDGVAASDIEYQAVLGRGWLSPWIEGGKFCGSRGMALPLLGLKLRLKGEAAKTHQCSYAASFVDGSTVGPVPGGETCEAESLAAMEALQIVIERRGGATAPRRPTRARAGQASESPPAAAAPAEQSRTETRDKPKRAARPATTPRRSR